MSRFAASTSVAPEKSRAEIEATLKRYGADQFGYTWDAEAARIMFRLKGILVCLMLPLPDRKAREYTHSSQGRRSPAAAEKTYDQAVRQRWRALLLVIKAKLEAVQSGISTLQREFLADTLLPNRQTAGEWLIPQIADAYATGQQPSLLLTNGPGG